MPHTTETIQQPSQMQEERGFTGRVLRREDLVYGDGAFDISGFPGRLIVLEGTDGVGRSTHIALLREWLEMRGFAVAHTAMTRSTLAGDGLRRAKEGHTLGQRALDLYYATDFADRLERDIIPALRAGFVVLTDRYIYSTMARSIVRGTHPDWIRQVYAFAPRPHAICYLSIDVEHLTPRILASGGFDYWESGMDFQEEQDVYHSFRRYQSRLIQVFETISREEKFAVIDARRSVREVFNDLKQSVQKVVSSMSSGT